MGDAVRDGGVHTGDPEDTIDGATPPSDAPKSQSAPTGDYGELLAVERHHYVVEGEIAKGGMGRVIAARDRRLGRDVAIKELLPKNRDATRRFEREARITARLQHPAIIHVYEAGVWPGGEPFYAMHKVAGRSLDKVVAERATLNERLGLLPHVIAVADALAYAHSERVIHRDLKPSNVLVGEFGETVVIDWGLAKDLDAVDLGDSLVRPRTGSDETMSGSVVGTPAYMPPEQARGESVDERADVYALGALLYKVLVGHGPYAGNTAQEIVDQVVAGPPQPVDDREPGTPADLAAIVQKAMAREREQRYATAGELAADLKRFQTGQLVAAHRYTAGQLFWRWLQRRRLAIAIGATAIVAIAVIATISVWQIVDQRSQAQAGRLKLLEERGRTELLDGHPGKALAYLAQAARDGTRGGARGFLIADARRQLARSSRLASGPLVAVSPDGKRIATARDVAIWRTDGSLEYPLGDVGPVRALVWDKDGARLAAAGDDGVAHVWGPDGRELAVLRGHTRAILGLAFDEAHDRIVTASADNTAIVWDLATRVPVATSRCHSGPVVSAQFSHDGERVVTASEDGTACVWNADNGETITPLRGHRASVESATWANDDRWVVTASDDGTARVWSADRGKPVVDPLRHDAGTVVRLAITSHDGHIVLTAGSDGVARLWELPATASDSKVPAPRPVPLVGHSGAIVSGAFSPDDAYVATGGVDHIATIWDPQRGQAIASFEHAEVVDSVAFASGYTLVTGSRDGSSWIWKTLGDRQRYDVESPVHGLAASDDGTVAAARDDSNITLVRDGKLEVLRGHMSRVFAVVLSSDGHTLVSGGEDPHPIVWDLELGTRRELPEHPAPIRALALHGDMIATAAGDEVRVFGRDGSLLHTLADRAATITTIAFDPQGGSLQGGTEDGTVVTWSLASEQPTVLHKLPTAIAAIAHSSRDDALVVAGPNHVAIFYPGAAPIYLDNPGEVRAAAFTSDGTRVITAGEDGAKVWDAATGKLLGTRDAHVRALEALAVHGDLLWLASSDGTLGAWDIPVDTESPDDLATFVTDYDPWCLDHHDVVQQRRPDGQCGSDRK
jgi:WD40 repeat protein/tRNA A-37 threonylcarbamoyl transferase component Bud32